MRFDDGGVHDVDKAAMGVSGGLGRIVALYYHASNLYHIHK
jgi:hypothetical protein